MQPTCIHLYCGSGKGKTTAALGQLLRNASEHMKIRYHRGDN